MQKEWVSKREASGAKPRQRRKLAIQRKLGLRPQIKAKPSERNGIPLSPEEQLLMQQMYVERMTEVYGSMEQAAKVKRKQDGTFKFLCEFFGCSFATVTYCLKPLREQYNWVKEKPKTHITEQEEREYLEQERLEQKNKEEQQND